MYPFRTLLLLPVLLTASMAAHPGAVDPWQFVPQRGPATDHSTFFKGPFSDGPSTTRACLECHPKAAGEIMRTAHWNLVGDEVQVPGHDEPVRIGKRNLINNFCIGIKSNWRGCTSCHIGFGWDDDSFDLSDESLVDCLVCHDQTGTYHKDAGDAGLPGADVDLLAVAQSVGIPRRANCGACHFMAGGGNAVKHGDLDESLLFPSPEIDVHMGKLGFECVDCHQAEDHLPPGRLLTVSVDDRNRLLCTRCHQGDAIHGDRRIDSHGDRVACQTCHIPQMAVKAGTKLTWDWSQAGQDLPIDDQHLYLKIKGRFTWVKGAQPEYAWYNGTGSRYLLGDRIDPRQTTQIAAPLGDREDPKARIYPFKIHRGKQVYDTEHRHFILPHVYGEKGFWTQFDWNDALRIGSETTGLPFSGNYDFAPTEMFLPQNHMVVGGDRALQCPDCHGEAGRMDWQALGYAADPVLRTMLEHEPIPLLDEEGEMVHESGNPLSTAMTCSLCHEIEEPGFLATHAYHTQVDAQDLNPQRRALMEQGPRIAADDGQQMNCFLCHLEQPNLAEWQQAITAGAPAWAVSATLIGNDLLRRTDEGYSWNPDVLEDDMAVVSMVHPRPSHCGNCHGLVHTDNQPLMTELGGDEHWTTENTGQVFSAQRIRLSALNLRNKDRLGRAWDLHAQRLVECGDCHYAQTPPGHLIAGDASAAAGGDAGLRRCESCHTDGAGHDWLPEQQRHFAAMACEACHVPQLHMPARSQVDETVLTTEGRPAVAYRGLGQGGPHDLAKAYITGYRPLLMRPSGDTDRVAPVNLVSRWYWVDGNTGKAVDGPQLQAAWLDGGQHRPQIVELFDSDRNGRVDDRELRLDGPDKIALIRSLLSAQGVADPVIRAELRAHHLHHDVALGEATRDCDSCHKAQQDGPFMLADYVPGGILPDTLLGLPASAGDRLQLAPDGSLSIARPSPLAAPPTAAKEKP